MLTLVEVREDASEVREGDKIGCVGDAEASFYLLHGRKVGWWGCLLEVGEVNEN